MNEASVGRSRYDGLNFSYRQRMTRHFSLNANYSLSRAMGWAIESGGTDGGSGFRNYPHDPLNPWDPRDFGPTPNDERHHITVSGVFDLPWGIQISPIIQYGSARPYDLISGFDVLARGSGYTRPVIVPNNAPTAANFIGDSATALACLAAGTCRQLGYDTARGDGFFQTDVRFAKNINLGEHRKLQLIFQAFNLTNKTNYGNDFHNTVGNPAFGTPEGYINPSSATTPRAFVGEFGARFTF
jgi:hypothetical protein